MQIGSRQFSPPLWAWLLFAVIAISMVMLGRWQLDRAREKIRMGDAADAARAAPALAIAEITDPVSAARIYTRVQITGEWLPETQFLWDNRTYNGRAGFEVITPMRTNNGKLVLINRGWVPLGASREDLPDVSMPADVVGSIQTVTGFFSRPSKGFASGEASSRGMHWPKFLQFFDYALIEELLSGPVIPGVVQVLELDGNGASDTGQIESLAREDSVGLWLIGNWQPDAAGPAKHYSYAFQWFAMATALAVIFVLVNLKRADPA